MSNLTAGQLAALTSGQPVRGVWSIKTPVSADHSSYTTTVIDDGLFSTGNIRRVIKAGQRTHKVWNPHPMEGSRPEAVRYTIEVGNGDGYFHRKSGSPWNPFGLYDAAPSECFLIHQLYVWDRSAATWSPITHMDFIGRVMSVDYTGAGSLIRREVSPGATGPGVAPNTATIMSEQVGAWETLRRVFSKDDGNRSTGIATFTAGGVALTLGSISPSTKVHGASTFTLTCTGTSYTTRCHVYLDGVRRTTTYSPGSSGTQLLATIPASDIATVGTRVIQVFDQAPGGGWSNTLNLTVT